MSEDVNGSSTLTELSDKEAARYLPAVIYMGILILIGLPGNICVLVIFSKYYKQNTYRTFVLALAVVDSLSCGISMPFEIISLRYMYNFQNEVACRIFKTYIVLISLTSMFIITGLSVDRYRRICHSTKVQMSIASVYIICGLSLAGGTFISVPYSFMSGTVYEDLGNNITGSKCLLADFNLKSNYLSYYSGVLWIVFLICVTVLSALYSLIAKTVYNHSRLRKQLFQSVKYRKKSHEESRTDTHASKDTVGQEEEPELDIAQSTKGNRTDKFKTDKGNAQLTFDKAKGKATKTAVLINVMFVLSYLPYGVVSIMLRVNYTMFASNQDNVVVAVISILHRAPFLNNVVNPFIYGFLDKNFRRHVKEILSCYRN